MMRVGVTWFSLTLENRWKAEVSFSGSGKISIKGIFGFKIY